MPEETQGKTVLFVDDEIYLAEVGQEMLEDYGYEVDIETDARDALARFRENPGRYGLLVTDYTMPGMTGDLLMEKVWEIRPDLPVILATGIGLPQDVQDRITTATFLMKPFDMGDLVKAVAAHLEQPSA